MTEPTFDTYDRRKGKWWVRSPQQWFNIVALLVLISTELSQHLRAMADFSAPGWVLEALAITTLIGNIILRALPTDNERLRLSDPEKKP